MQTSDAYHPGGVAPCCAPCRSARTSSSCSCSRSVSDGFSSRRAPTVGGSSRSRSRNCSGTAAECSRPWRAKRRRRGQGVRAVVAGYPRPRLAGARGLGPQLRLLVFALFFLCFHLLTIPQAFGRPWRSRRCRSRRACGTASPRRCRRSWGRSSVRPSPRAWRRCTSCWCGRPPNDSCWSTNSPRRIANSWAHRTNWAPCNANPVPWGTFTARPDIHDTLAQGFSSILLLARAGRRGNDAAPIFDQIADTAQENLVEARRVVAALAPADLESAPLESALRRLVAQLGDQTGIIGEVHTDGEDVPLPMDYDVALLRVAQSSLANVRLHSRAQRVRVTLTYEADEVRLDVVDDGSVSIPARPVDSVCGPCASDSRSWEERWSWRVLRTTGLRLPQHFRWGGRCEWRAGASGRRPSRRASGTARPARVARRCGRGGGGVVGRGGGGAGREHRTGRRADGSSARRRPGRCGGDGTDHRGRESNACRRAHHYDTDADILRAVEAGASDTCSRTRRRRC